MTSAEYVDFKGLPSGSLLDVETRNRHYHIECLGDDAIRISGHPEYCPTPVPGKLRGSSDREGVVESGLITRGKGGWLWLTTEGKMLFKVFAVTAVIGLLVTGSAAFVANHPRGLAACAADCD